MSENESRSYQIPEVKALMDKTLLTQDFDVLLKSQIQGVKKFYIEKYPDKAEEFTNLLEHNNFIETEIENGRHRLGLALQENFSLHDMKMINDFFETEFGKRALTFCILVKEQLRVQRNLIANSHHSRLESIAKGSIHHPINAKS